MMNRIRGWIDSQNDRLRLQALDDRMLADIGVDRSAIRNFVRGGVVPTESVATARPLGMRLKSATTAFVRELRSDADAHRVVTH